MKKILFVLSALISIVMAMAFSTGGAEDAMNAGGAPAGFCGDPASGGANCRSCHLGPILAPLTGVITSNIPPAGYTPSGTYTITATFVRAGHTKFGCEISPQNPSGTLLGSMTVISSGTQLVGTGKYITHTSSGVSGSGNKTWNFLWTAPATSQGPVTFYGAFNATNSNLASTGDSIFISTMVATENPSAVQNFHGNIYSFSTFPNPTAAHLNVTFTLQEPSAVEMELLDINGNKARNLFSEVKMNGDVNQSFNLSSYTKGIYFIRLNVDGNYSLHKIVKM